MFSPEQREAILRDVISGMTTAEVCRAHGCSSTLVRQVCLEHGIARRRGRRGKDWRPFEDVALTGGAWVLDPRRRVMVYRAA